MIKANAHKYSVSAMCKVLQVSRSTCYYEAKQKTDESELTAAIIDIFKSSRNNYGTHKVKQELTKRDMIVSRRRIGRIMKQEGLVSAYTTAQFHPQKDTCNESTTANHAASVSPLCLHSITSSIHSSRERPGVRLSFIMKPPIVVNSYFLSK